MGLILHGKKHAVLTDIQGMEDSLGEMDFKVAGTVDGITAIQMDIKVDGITIDIMREALTQAKKARLVIIDKLKETLPAARTEMSPFAPRMIVVTISPDKIKDVIGPGGKVINKIIADTGAKIDIENDGHVYISAPDGVAAEKAKAMVEALTKSVQVGETYLGTVTRLMNFGAFVAILPGKEGLVHISQLAPQRVERVEDVVKIGDQIMVKVVEIDSQGRINLSRKAVLGGAAGDDNGAAHCAAQRRTGRCRRRRSQRRTARSRTPSSTPRLTASPRFDSRATGSGNAGARLSHWSRSGRDAGSGVRQAEARSWTIELPTHRARHRARFAIAHRRSTRCGDSERPQPRNCSSWRKVARSEFEASTACAPNRRFRGRRKAGAHADRLADDMRRAAFRRTTAT